MAVSGIHLGRRSDSHIARLLEAAETAGLSYDHVGSTCEPGSPRGVSERSFQLEVPGTLKSAGDALREWAPHDGIRAHIHPADAPLEEGCTLIVVAPFGPFELAVPDRIVAVIDDPQRFGFAYGTVDTHAETGEELFLAEEIQSNRLRLTIRIHARPASTLARLGAPAVTRIQSAAARRYLTAWCSRLPPSGTG